MKPVFKDDTDRQNFLNTVQHDNKRYKDLSRLLPHDQPFIIFLIETPDSNLALVMRQLIASLRSSSTSASAGTRQF
jgi:hypothetical protein